jgi:hypothetical protein
LIWFACNRDQLPPLEEGGAKRGSKHFQHELNVSQKKKNGDFNPEPPLMLPPDRCYRRCARRIRARLWHVCDPAAVHVFAAPVILAASLLGLYLYLILSHGPLDRAATWHNHGFTALFCITVIWTVILVGLLVHCLCFWVRPAPAGQLEPSIAVAVVSLS